MSEREPTIPKRLDQYIVEHLPGSSRSAAVSLIKDGKVTLNQAVASKPSQKVAFDDTVVIDYDQAATTTIPQIELPVVYEDADCVAINKPVGILSHSKGAFYPEATVATWLQSRLKDWKGERAGIVHRLDRATSGIMLCAKSPEALHWLQKQFSLRKVKKTYVAIVTGSMDPKEAVIDMPIERNPKLPSTFRVGANGKSARTHYRVLSETASYSELELSPETGRTHQLRVHLKQLGHPIVGDTFYGGKPAERLYLHAKQLEITLPNHERTVLSTPLPKLFAEKLRED